MADKVRSIAKGWHSVTPSLCMKDTSPGSRVLSQGVRRDGVRTRGKVTEKLITGFLRMGH